MRTIGRPGVGTSAWTCWDADNSEEDDACEVYATDADFAAERLASHRYSDEPFESAKINVRVGAAVLTFVVTAEPDVHFRAIEVQP